MHSEPYTIECRECGCPEVNVLKRPAENEWFPSGLAQCAECGARFSFSPAENVEKEPAAKTVDAQRYYGQDGGIAVAFRPVRCPSCRSKNVPVQHTTGRVRYHKCGDCGESFKSVEK